MLEKNHRPERFGPVPARRGQGLQDPAGKARVVQVGRGFPESPVEQVQFFVHLIRAPGGQRFLQFLPAPQDIRFHGAERDVKNAGCFIMR